MSISTATPGGVSAPVTRPAGRRWSPGCSKNAPENTTAGNEPAFVPDGWWRSAFGARLSGLGGGRQVKRHKCHKPKNATAEEGHPSRIHGALTPLLICV